MWKIGSENVASKSEYVKLSPNITKISYAIAVFFCNTLISSELIWVCPLLVYIFVLAYQRLLMNQHSSISVIITVKSRIEAFTAFVNRLEKAELPPRELIVVWMGRPSEHSLYKSEVFNIVHRFDNCEELDIAGARNRGLAAATSSLCLFMNVESIFSPQLFKCLQNSWSQSRVITSKISCVSEDISLTDYSDLIEHTNNNPETKENGSDCAFSIRQNSTLFFALEPTI